MHDKITALKNSVNSLVENFADGIIAINYDNRRGFKILMTGDSFMSRFAKYTQSDVDTTVPGVDYPIERFYVVNDVKFFALFKEGQ